MDPKAVWIQRLFRSRDCPDPETVRIQRLYGSRGCLDPEAVRIQRLSGSRGFKGPEAVWIFWSRLNLLPTPGPYFITLYMYKKRWQ
jgi:hypothetical protein